MNLKIIEVDFAELGRELSFIKALAESDFDYFSCPSPLPFLKGQAYGIQRGLLSGGAQVNE